MHAASLTQDLNKKATLYKKASDKFPSDVRAKNNLGCVYIQLGKTDEAEQILESAKSIENNEAVKNNLGVVYMLKGNLEKAEEIYTTAGNTKEANYNLGIINIKKGKYDVAVGNFAGTNDFNAALAKLLNKNYNEAMNTLTSSKDESAMAYYLKAIIGARMDNSDMVFNNLRTAVGKDIKLKAYAVKDVEFMKYFTNDTFKSIIQ